MNSVEFAEKISGLTLFEWQKDLLMKIEKKEKEKMATSGFDNFVKKMFNVKIDDSEFTKIDESHTLSDLIKGDLINTAESKEEIKSEDKSENDEWILVEGYKATDSDMTCNDYQYEFDKLHEMPEEEIKECHSGFHLCLKLEDVFHYYAIGEGHRYFKVSALVRRKDYEEYLNPKKNNKTAAYTTYGWMNPFIMNDIRNKLVSKQIRFIRELTIDEVFEHTKHADWSEERKKLAMEKGIEYVENLEKEDNLVELGYSRPFSVYIRKENRYDVAYAVGTQKDLSMDMKCLMIFKG